MPLPYEVLNEQRIFCGRCRNQTGQSRYSEGPFDSDTIDTYICGHCDCVYAICKVCARFVPDGKICPYNHEAKD